MTINHYSVNFQGINALFEQKGLKMPSRLQTSLEIKALNDDGTFTGYGGIFGNIDGDNDIIAKGAFEKSLTNDIMPKMLWQHRSDQLAGKWTSIKEDAHGLLVTGQLNLDKQLGKDIYSDLKFGSLDAMSVGFQTVNDEYDSKAGIRTINEAKLWEVSLVTFPANDSARITAVKSSKDILTVRDLEGALRDAGFSKKEAVSVASRFNQKLNETGRDASDELSQIKKAILQMNETYRKI